MRKYGRTLVYEFLGDMVVYRNLVPMDSRLPPLAELWGIKAIGVPPGVIPRKNEVEYAQVMVHLLRRAQALNLPGVFIERLIYVGDTRMNDGAAFAHLCQVGGWPGWAFIGAEHQDEPTRVEIVEPSAETDYQGMYLANHWSTLMDFDQLCTQRGHPVDEHTAVIVDLDKTALGARGRNDHVIDQARVTAVERVVHESLGTDFHLSAVRAAYDQLNQPEFHPFTADNQDYLAYICLILGSGLYRLDDLLEEIRAGQMKCFGHFIAAVDRRKAELSAPLREVHDEIYAAVQAKDPTPFKLFRRHEYRATVERMGCLEDDSPVEQLLAQEIVITQEVREMALAWREQGALLFGLSDKPDEASIPSMDLVAEGYRPIHWTETHAVGSEENDYTGDDIP